jgi:hypothetical protein
MPTTTAKLRRRGGVRGVLRTGLLHRVSGAGFWTLRQEVAGHQRPYPLIGVIQNIGNPGKLRGGILCNAGYVHGKTSR